jgi:hypothetical protein
MKLLADASGVIGCAERDAWGQWDGEEWHSDTPIWSTCIKSREGGGCARLCWLSWRANGDGGNGQSVVSIWPTCIDDSAVMVGGGEPMGLRKSFTPIWRTCIRPVG